MCRVRALAASVILVTALIISALQDLLCLPPYLLPIFFYLNSHSPPPSSPPPPIPNHIRCMILALRPLGKGIWLCVTSLAGIGFGTDWQYMNGPFRAKQGHEGEIEYPALRMAPIHDHLEADVDHDIDQTRLAESMDCRAELVQLESNPLLPLSLTPNRTDSSILIKIITWILLESPAKQFP